MRVLMLYNDYQVLGGENLSVVEEAAGLQAAGVTCELYTVSNDELRGSGRLTGARTVAAGGGARPDLLELARRFRPDLVHAQNLFPLLARGASELLSTTRLPWVRHLRNYRLRCLSADLWRDGGPCTDCTSSARGLPGVLHGCYRSSRAESTGAVLAARAERRLLDDWTPSAFVALSAGMREALGRALPAEVPVYVKPDGLTERDLVAAPASSTHLFVGRLTGAKGYRHVLGLAQARPRLAFTVVGDGEGADDVATAAQRLPNLTWHRSLPQAGVLDLMRAARLVLVPSQWEEPFGRVAAEAASVGTPAVVQATGGLVDIVRPVDERLVVAGRDLDSWLAAIDALDAATPAEHERLRRRAFEHFRRTYSLTATSARLADIYDEVLARARAA